MNAKFLKYTRQFDGLRFLAVTIVIVYHYFIVNWNVSDRADLGNLISFFFVLSGYLITALLFRLRFKEPGNNHFASSVQKTGIFIAGRAMRIFPAYFVYIALVAMLPVAGEYLRDNSPYFIFFNSNLLNFQTQEWDAIGMTTHLWTLAVEEQFYLIWPLIVLFIPSKSLKRVFLIIIGMTVAFRGLHYAIALNSQAFHVTPDILTTYCFDAFAMGGLLSLLHLQDKKVNPYIGKWLIPGAMLYIGLAFVPERAFSVMYNRFYLSLLTVFIVEKAYVGFKGIPKMVMENGIAVYLGKISYSMYLYHMLAPHLFWGGFDKLYWYSNDRGLNLKPLSDFLARPVPSLLVGFGCTVIMASVSYHLLETPINRYRKIRSKRRMEQESLQIPALPPRPIFTPQRSLSTGTGTGNQSVSQKIRYKP